MKHNAFIVESCKLDLFAGFLWNLRSVVSENKEHPNTKKRNR